MESYEEKVQRELEHWRRKITRRSSLVDRFSKRVQNRINQVIPARVHRVITESIKKMVEMTMTGSDYFSKPAPNDLPLEEMENAVRAKISHYRKTASIEGAGTGAGGILLGAVDFPALLAIKINLLFEIAAAYGFDPRQYKERIYILYIFQLAFSSEKRRKQVFTIIDQWQTMSMNEHVMDWRKLQQEYRDYLDLAKLLQLVPGFGAVVGAYANYKLLDHLGETAMNCYRLRKLNEQT
jgi:hypothetical protein